MTRSDTRLPGTSVWQRMGEEVETVGIQPVPDEQRTMTPGKLLNVWIMASASATTMLIGALLFSVGLWYMIGAIVLSWVIAFIPSGILSEMGRQLPLTIMMVARRTYGWIGSFSLSGLFTFVNMAWFGLNVATGAEVLATLAHTGVTPWCWVVGGADILLVLFGMKWVEYFYRYTAVLLIVSYAALTAYLALHFHLHMPRQTQPMVWGAQLSTVLGFSVIGWLYVMSTVSRFCRPASQTPRRTAYFLLPSIGIMIPVLLMGVIGMFSQEATGNWNVALLGAHISGWGAVAAIGVTLAVVHTNALNLYPASMDFLVIIDSVSKRRRWEQPVATIVFGLLGTVLALAGILNHAETFVTDVGDVVAPFTFILTVDWLWALRDKTNAATYFAKPKAFAGQWRWTAMICAGIGFVVSFWGNHFLPGFAYNDLPLPVVGGVVAAALYAATLTFSKPPTPATGPAIEPAAGTVGQETRDGGSRRTEPALDLPNGKRQVRGPQAPSSVRDNRG
jgi:nucleobase:cation symporter-1, NCS1 family